MEKGDFTPNNTSVGLPEVTMPGSTKTEKGKKGPQGASTGLGGFGRYTGPDFVFVEESRLNPKDEVFDKEFIDALGLPEQMYIPSEFKGLAPGKIYDTGYLLGRIFNSGELPSLLTEEAIAKSLYEEEKIKSGLGSEKRLSPDKVGEINARSRTIAERIADSLVPLCRFRLLYNDGSITKIGGDPKTKGGLLAEKTEGGIGMNFADVAKLFLDTPEFKGDNRGIRALNILLIASGYALPPTNQADVATSIKIRQDKQKIVFRDSGGEQIRQYNFADLMKIHGGSVGYTDVKKALDHYYGEIAKDLRCGIGTVKLAATLFATLGSKQQVESLRNLLIDFKEPGTGNKGLMMLQYEDMDILNRARIAGENGILGRKLKEGGAKSLLETLLLTTGPGQEMYKAWGGLASIESSAKKFRVNLLGLAGGEGDVSERMKTCTEIINELRPRIPIINDQTRDLWAHLVAKQFKYKESPMASEIREASRGGMALKKYAAEKRKKETPSLGRTLKDWFSGM